MTRDQPACGHHVGSRSDFHYEPFCMLSRSVCKKVIPKQATGQPVAGEVPPGRASVVGPASPLRVRPAFGRRSPPHENPVGARVFRGDLGPPLQPERRQPGFHGAPPIVCQ